MNEWMNEGVLIRYLGKWMTFWRSLGLDPGGGVRWGELRVRWGVGAFFLVRCWKRFFSILERFWEVLGSQNGGQNRFLRSFLAAFFRMRFQHRFWIVFWRLRTLKIELPPRREHDFHKIDVFKKSLKNHWFSSHFWMPKPWKFDRKTY